MDIRVENKRIDTERNGAKWFRADIAVYVGGEEVHRRSVQRSLNNFKCGTPCIQKLLDKHKAEAKLAVQNAERIDLDALG